MTQGLVVGKFLPPHQGHSYLIDQALASCDQLTVLICDRPEYLIPATLRRDWLQELYPRVRFVIIADQLDDNDSEGWAKNTIAKLGRKPDKVFTSEDYGVTYARFLGARHIMVDKARKTVPISATAIREDPWRNWQYLSEPVRGYFAKRVCIVGAESTGTTTLAEALATQFQTSWVPEYGRQYNLDQKARLDREGWRSEDFIKIAQHQNKLEDTAARTANRLLFCDTDSFTTSVWHEHYMGERSWQVEQQAIGRRYDLYLLTDVNIPFVQDDIRDGEDIREWMHQRFMEKLRFWGKPFVVITGTPEARLTQAAGIVQTLLDDKAVEINSLHRDHWHPNSF